MANKRRWGDRKDGTLIRGGDAMHDLIPLIHPNRCDNEAYITETIDLTNLDKFLEKKNADDPMYKYNMFQCIVTTALKTITLRSKMNRFIANRNVYQRNEVTASFTIKREFDDNGAEVLAFIHSTPEDNLDSIHDKMLKIITGYRKNKSADETTDTMDILTKLPKPVKRGIANVVSWLDKHGWGPEALTASDPFQASVLLANIGSIGLKAGYHHLTNWGTTSVFIVVGKAEMKPFYKEDGSIEMRHAVDLGLTIDERLADGYYYSGTVKMMKLLLENPELLEAPLGEKLSDEMFQKIRAR